MSTTGDFKSDQYEFTDEQAKNVGALAHSMGAVAMMLKLLGLAFVIFRAYNSQSHSQRKTIMPHRWGWVLPHYCS